MTACIYSALQKLSGNSVQTSSCQTVSLLLFCHWMLNLRSLAAGLGQSPDLPKLVMLLKCSRLWFSKLMQLLVAFETVPALKQAIFP